MHWTTTRSSLIARLKDPGDENAWRSFDDLYGEVIVRYARTRGLTLEDAEDVRQNVLFGLVRFMPRFELRRDRGKFRSYLGRVVGNAIHRYRSRAHRSREWLTADMVEFDRGVEAVELDEQWEREWVEHHLRRALLALRGSMSARSLEIFGRLLDGASPEDVARERDTTVEAVKKVRQRVRARLRETVDRQASEEDHVLARLNGRSGPGDRPREGHGNGNGKSR